MYQIIITLSRHFRNPKIASVTSRGTIGVRINANPTISLFCCFKVEEALDGERAFERLHLSLDGHLAV